MVTVIILLFHLMNMVAAYNYTINTQSMKVSPISVVHHKDIAMAEQPRMWKVLKYCFCPSSSTLPLRCPTFFSCWVRSLVQTLDVTVHGGYTPLQNRPKTFSRPYPPLKFPLKLTTKR